jgi:hypothetical protein
MINLIRTHFMNNSERLRRPKLFWSHIHREGTAHLSEDTIEGVTPRPKAQWGTMLDALRHQVGQKVQAQHVAAAPP